MGKQRLEPGRGKRSGVVKKTKKQAQTTRLFYIVIFLVIAGGLGALTYVATRSPAATLSQYDPSLPAVVSNGYTLGNPNAPLEIVEYADFECPACGQFATVTEPDVRAQYVNSGKVRWRFIDFPLPVHRNTWNASRAAACADEQGQFWQMHDALFQTQDQWNSEATSSPDKFLKKLARQIGLDGDRFDQCLDSKKTQAKVQAHWKLAMDAHIDGTPTFIANGVREPRPLTYDQFKDFVDRALAAAPAAKPVASAAGSSAAAGKTGR